MAATLDHTEELGTPQMGGTQTGAANALAAREARKNTRYEELFAAKAASLVPGVGHVINDGVPLNKAAHGTEIMTAVPRHHHEDPRRHHGRRMEHR